MNAVTNKYLSMVMTGEMALNDIPAELVTTEICMAAVEQNCHQIKNVPAELITEQMCISAVKGSWGLIRSIPKHLHTMDVIFHVLEQNPVWIRHVEADMADKIVEIAIKHWPTKK